MLALPSFSDCSRLVQMLVNDFDDLTGAADALGIRVHLGSERRHQLEWIVLFHANKVRFVALNSALQLPDFPFE